MTEERKNPIIRREQITVAHAQQNQYGDLIVKTKAGNELKVGKKRQHLFDIFQPGTEVIVGFSSYMNKEYINEAAQASQVVSTDTPVKKESDHLVIDVKEAVKMNIAPQEKGMWWKEVGENFRAGLFKKDEGNGALLWTAYIAQMLSSLEITIETKRKEAKTTK